MNFEPIGDFPGYMISYFSQHIIRGSELVHPTVPGGTRYMLQHPDQQGPAEWVGFDYKEKWDECEFSKLWESAFGSTISGMIHSFSQYTTNAAGIVFDSEGNRVKQTALPRRGTGNNMGSEPAVSLVADDGLTYTVKVLELLEAMNRHEPFKQRVPEHVPLPFAEFEAGKRKWLPEGFWPHKKAYEEPEQPVQSSGPSSTHGRMGVSGRRGRMGTSAPYDGHTKSWKQRHGR
jgi:hypothetical protein